MHLLTIFEIQSTSNKWLDDKIRPIPTDYMVRSYHPIRKINGASLIGLFKRSSVDRPQVQHVPFSVLEKGCEHSTDSGTQRDLAGSVKLALRVTKTSKMRLKHAPTAIVGHHDCCHQETKADIARCLHVCASRIKELPKSCTCRKAILQGSSGTFEVSLSHLDSCCQPALGRRTFSCSS